jgi:ABC-type branched-subunit amino acid transport system substrate-binding protein
VIDTRSRSEMGRALRQRMPQAESGDDLKGVLMRRFFGPRASVKMRAGVIGALALTIALVVSACGGSGSTQSGSTTKSSGGVIKIGSVTPVTGALSSDFGPDVQAGIQARFDAVNAAGGIHGKKLEVVTADNASNPAQEPTAIQSLLSQHVLALAAWDPVFFGGLKAAVQANIPVIGGAFGAPSYGDPKYSTLVSVLGPTDMNYAAFDNYGKFLKSVGAKKVAVIAYAGSPPSEGSATSFANSAKAEGVQVCYSNLTAPIGSTNFTAIALAIKKAGCDAVYGAMTLPSDVALNSAVRSAGVALKASVATQGYQQSTLQSKTVSSQAQGMDFLSHSIPIESNPNNAMSQQLAKYAHFHGIPSFGMEGGWDVADAIVEGLEKAGPNPSSASLLKSLRSMSDFTAGGTYAGPANFTAAKIGTGNPVLDGVTCFNVEKLEGSSFRAVAGGPFCGTKVSN